MNVIGTPQRLKKAREDAGLTQEQLAQRARTKQEAIARVESGKGNLGIKLALRLAEALNSDPLYLMNIEKNLENSTT